MEKRKNILKFIIAIPLGIFCLAICLVLNTLFETAMLFCCFYPYEIMLVTGYFMVMIIYGFHKVTKGIWAGYLECGFLPVICWWVYMIFIDTSTYEIVNQLTWECRFVLVCWMAMLLSDFLYKKKCKVTVMNISILVTLFGFFSYYSVAIIGGL